MFAVFPVSAGEFIIDGFVKSEAPRPQAELPGKELFDYIVPLGPACTAGLAGALPVQLRRCTASFPRLRGGRLCGVPNVRLIPQDLRALHLKLFTLPSNIDFLRVYQS